jgi:voltage-gated potassium channel
MESTIRNRLLAGLIAMLVVIVGGACGYWIIGDGRWSFGDCIYMTVITVTTVGYGETLVGMESVPYARAYTVVQLVFGTGVLVYFASTITAFIVEGDLSRVLASQRLRKRVRNMKDHMVVCGAGTTGRHIIEELLKIEASVVAIDQNEEELQAIRAKYPRADFAYLVGDATDDDVMANANLTSARGLVAALASDKDNLYLIVAARQSAPQVRVIARCTDVALIERLKRAGADGVVSPNFIGGMRMVSELVRPSVVRFLDDMMRDKRAAYRVEEVTVGTGSALCDQTLRDADIHARFGMQVIACRDKDADPWTYNPEPGQKLRSGTVLVVVGSADQVRELRAKAAG